MKTISEAETQIRSAIKQARERGYQIKPAVMLSNEHLRCCAVGALAAVSNRNPEFPYDAAGMELDLDLPHVLAIALGFDKSTKKEMPYPEWQELGRRLRAEVDSGVL